MLKGTSRNFNHSKKGACIKVDPIRDLEAIAVIKRQLEAEPRNLCLFTLGINTAYRASELLSITVGQISALNVGDRLEIKQRKTQKYRAVTLNHNSDEAIKNWLQYYPYSVTSTMPLFLSQKRREALSVEAVIIWSKNGAEMRG